MPTKVPTSVKSLCHQEVEAVHPPLVGRGQDPDLRKREDAITLAHLCHPAADILETEKNPNPASVSECSD